MITTEKPKRTLSTPSVVRRRVTRTAAPEVDGGESEATRRQANRAVRRWLIATALSVVAAVSVGGITRLTDSGLAITEWKPVSGVLPPLSGAAWSDAYQSYLKIPEAQTVNRGITLGEFKRLYWWEWFHRILARTVGLIIVVPFFVLLLRKQIRPSLHLRLANIPLLTAMQGAMGWYMVRSGLTDRTDVSPYRLVAHLTLALVIFSVAVWTATALGRATRPGSLITLPVHRRLPMAAIAVAALAFFTMMSGGFVAGLDAGVAFNTFPLMAGHVIPPGYGALNGWRNFFENPVAAQFDHRLLAVLTAACVLALWVVSERLGTRYLTRRLRIAALLVLVQVGLGIATLLLVVPTPLAVLHQLGGVALLGSLVAAAAEAADARDGFVPVSSRG